MKNLAFHSLLRLKDDYCISCTNSHFLTFRAWEWRGVCWAVLYLGSIHTWPHASCLFNIFWKKPCRKAIDRTNYSRLNRTNSQWQVDVYRLQLTGPPFGCRERISKWRWPNSCCWGPEFEEWVEVSLGQVWDLCCFWSNTTWPSATQILLCTLDHRLFCLWVEFPLSSLKRTKVLHREPGP